MNVDWVRRVCMSFPHVTEQIQWGNDLVFKVGGKMFAVAATEPKAVCLSFKSSPEAFTELVEREGVIPAPYLARAYWVALETPDAVPARELHELLRVAHQLVFEKLPKKAKATLGIHREN